MTCRIRSERPSTKGARFLRKSQVSPTASPAAAPTSCRTLFRFDLAELYNRLRGTANPASPGWKERSMSRLALGIFAAGCLASLALAPDAYAQQCGGGGQGPSQFGGGGQRGFAMQGMMQSGFGMQGGFQSPEQQMAQTGMMMAAVEQAGAQIAANRHQERIRQAAYGAMMAELNRERFEKVAEAEQKRRDAIRERNRLRSLEQNAEKQLREVAAVTVER